MQDLFSSWEVPVFLPCIYAAGLNLWTRKERCTRLDFPARKACHGDAFLCACSGTPVSTLRSRWTAWGHPEGRVPFQAEGRSWDQSQKPACSTRRHHHEAITRHTGRRATAPSWDALATGAWAPGAQTDCHRQIFPVIVSEGRHDSLPGVLPDSRGSG